MRACARRELDAIRNAKQRVLIVGDSTATTYELQRMPLIDLKARTIAFANAHQSDWTDSWLAISDIAKYSWYATLTDGVISKPDTTHFRQRGADAVTGMVAAGIRRTPELAG